MNVTLSLWSNIIPPSKSLKVWVENQTILGLTLGCNQFGDSATSGPKLKLAFAIPKYSKEIPVQHFTVWWLWCRKTTQVSWWEALSSLQQRHWEILKRIVKWKWNNYKKPNMWKIFFCDLTLNLFDLFDVSYHWVINKLASLVDGIAITGFWNYDPPTHWLDDRGGC